MIVSSFVTDMPLIDRSIAIDCFYAGVEVAFVESSVEEIRSIFDPIEAEKPTAAAAAASEGQFIPRIPSRRRLLQGVSAAKGIGVKERERRSK